MSRAAISFVIARIAASVGNTLVGGPGNNPLYCDRHTLLADIGDKFVPIGFVARWHRGRGIAQSAQYRLFDITIAELSHNGQHNTGDRTQQMDFGFQSLDPSAKLSLEVGRHR